MEARRQARELAPQAPHNQEIKENRSSDSTEPTHKAARNATDDNTTAKRRVRNKSLSQDSSNTSEGD